MTTNADVRYADVVEGVRATIAAYTHALDDGRTDDVVATFCADGVCDIPGMGAHEGHEALRDAYAKWKPRQPQRHLVLNTHVTDWTAHAASAVSDVVFVLQGDAGWTIRLVGRYEDLLHNNDGTWRFHRREAVFVTEPAARRDSMTDATTDYDAVDFFRGNELLVDPYAYFDWLRSQCPVHREPQHGVYMVTGYDEACAVYANTDTFSSCNSVTGPFPGFPVPLDGRDDVSELIEQHRHELPFSDQILTMDPPKHRDHRHLLMRQLTPKRLKENEEFVWRAADRQIDELIGRGECEFIGDYANPFTLYVIADLLGVPEEEHEEFRDALARRPRTDAVGSTSDAMSHNPLAWLYDRFSRYIEDRRREPRDDVLTALATTTFPNGELPEVIDVVRVASNVFAAGQETTVRLLGTSLQLIAERADLQQLLRDRPDLVPDLVEETLRIESPVKGDFRLARRRTTVGDAEVPAGSTVMVLNGAANRDPRHFDDPAAFRVDRSNSREQLAFGRGVHSCPGGSLARMETRVSIERLLDRTDDIRISESAHGPAGDRRYQYVPTYILRGLTRLHLEFSPK